MHSYIFPVCLPSNSVKMPVYLQNLIVSIFSFELNLKLGWRHLRIFLYLL